VSSIEDYYRVKIFIPFNENFINQLKTRFLNNKFLFDGLVFDLSVICKIKPVLNIMFCVYFIGF
jgi:hypothetical protein